VQALAFSPDGLTLAVGLGGGLTEGRGAAQRWDLRTRGPVGALMSQRGAVVALAVGPDGQALLTGCLDGTAQFWSATGAAQGPPLRHAAAVTQVAFSPDGRLALTVTRVEGARGGAVYLWGPDTGRQFGPALRLRGEVLAAAFSPDGTAVAAAGGEPLKGEARVWDVTPVADEPERVTLWAEVLARQALGADGRPVALGEEALAARRERLERLGGPPLRP
jgi:WD40 repeat protein